MKKIDLRKKLKDLYSASLKSTKLVDVPEMQFLMIDGRGDPNDSSFQEAVEALYSMAYRIKFRLKDSGLDFVVMPLEGLWWSPDTADFSLMNK